MSTPTKIRVRRLHRGLFRDLDRWEAEVELDHSPNFTTISALTKGGAIRESRRIYERSQVPLGTVPL